MVTEYEEKPMNVRGWTVGLALVICGSSPALAFSQTCEGAYTTRDMEECLGRELEDVNTQLRHAVEDAGGRLFEPSAAELLARAQEQWEAYRTTQCRSVYASLEGGSMAGIAYLGCSIRLAQTRLKELADLYDPGGEGEPAR